MKQELKLVSVLGRNEIFGVFGAIREGMVHSHTLTCESLPSENTVLVIPREVFRDAVVSDAKLFSAIEKYAEIAHNKRESLFVKMQGTNTFFRRFRFDTHRESYSEGGGDAGSLCQPFRKEEEESTLKKEVKVRPVATSKGDRTVVIKLDLLNKGNISLREQQQ